MIIIFDFFIPQQIIISIPREVEQAPSLSIRIYLSLQAKESGGSKARLASVINLFLLSLDQASSLLCCTAIYCKGLAADFKILNTLHRNF